VPALIFAAESPQGSVANVRSKNALEADKPSFGFKPSQTTSPRHDANVGTGALAMTRRPQLKFPVETFKSIQFWLTVAALTLAPLFFGSVDLLWVAIWAVLLSISTLIGAAGPLSTAQRRVLFAFLALSSAYALVAIVQVAPGLIEHLDDPIWRRADAVLGLNALPRISSRAEIPPEAIGHFLLLVTSFVSGFLVATSRRNGDMLVQFARYSILAYAIYGMAALVFTPNLLLWAPKLAYRGSLTATFVNHNTAATLLGAGAILWFCLACLSLQSLRYSSIRLLLLVPSNERVAFTIILHSVAGLVCFVALLLTGSRGGLICTALGLLVAIVLMVTNRLRPRFWYVAGSASVALALIAGWLSQTGRIGSKGLLDDARILHRSHSPATAAWGRRRHLRRPVSIASSRWIQRLGSMGLCPFDHSRNRRRDGHSDRSNGRACRGRLAGHPGSSRAQVEGPQPQFACSDRRNCGPELSALDRRFLAADSRLPDSVRSTARLRSCESNLGADAAPQSANA